MIESISTLLANPLNQALFSIPLSVVGNLSTDILETLFCKLNNTGRLEKLEDTLFLSFIKALEIHQNRYDRIAGKKSEKLKDLARGRKKEFLYALNSFDGIESYAVPAQLDDKQVQEMFITALSKIFDLDTTDEQAELVTVIIRDTCVYYRDAFFQTISQEQQLWIIFRESIQINSIVELIKDIQQRLPSREEFESIRYHILATDRIDADISSLKCRYLEYLERKFSSIELTGVSPRVHGQDIAFALEEIFIPLKLKASEFHLESSIISSTTRLRQLFSDQESQLEGKIMLLQYLERYPYLTLLGDPGGGKSTLLRYLAVLICRFQNDNKFLPFYIPIFVKISEYARLLKKNPTKRLFDFLLTDYDKQYSQLFQWAFDNGQILLILDGLDEVLDTSQRLKVVDEVQDMIARRPENRYIVSSRIIGYEEARLGSKFAHFIIQPFKRTQIEAFCQSWYTALTKNSTRDLAQAKLDADKLFSAIISKKEIENLACNPLLITLIANIHFKGQSLPHNRVQLYDIATETLLQYWVQLRVSDESQLQDKDDVIEILSPIAFYIHESSPEGLIEEKDFHTQCNRILQREEYNLSHREIRREIKDLIKFLREQSGFFHEKGIDESTNTRFFGFLHQTFQEYLTAIEIVNQWKESTVDFRHLVTNPRWIESLRLAAGILKGEKGRAGKRNVTQFVQDILYGGKKEMLEYYYRALFVVSLIMIDDIDILPASQEGFFNEFMDSWAEASEQEVLKEFRDHASLILRSQHKGSLWQRIENVLTQDAHPLQKQIPEILIDNLFYMQQAKQYFLNLLEHKNEYIAKNAWVYFQRYMNSIDQQFYYAVQQYGDVHYAWQEEDPTYSVDSLVSYAEFLTIVDKLDTNRFIFLLPLISKLIYHYTYIFYSDGWTGPSKDYITQMKPQMSPRVLTAFLATIEESSDLAKYEEDLNEIFDQVEVSDALFNTYVRRVRQKIALLNQDKPKP